MFKKLKRKLLDLFETTKYRKRFNTVDTKYKATLEKYTKLLEEKSDRIDILEKDFMSMMRHFKKLEEVIRDVENKSKRK